MTGCKGYGLRGSDARTEIERTKEADTPGEIPGRSGLQADRRTGNKFIMRGVWLRSKELEEIIMTLSMSTVACGKKEEKTEISKVAVEVENPTTGELTNDTTSIGTVEPQQQV